MENHTEIWRDIIETEGRYQVSNLGQIRYNGTRRLSTKGRIRKPHIVHGYPHVTMWIGKIKMVAIHRAVAVAFLGEPPDGYEVNHIDRNRQNARLDNLEYVTQQQNVDHSACNHPKGEKVYNAKLKNEQVLEIRRLLAEGCSTRALGRRFSISPTVIQDIMHKKTWTHI